MAKIAFLIYKKHLKNAKRGRKEVFSFDGQSNVGVYMIRDALQRAGIETAFCDPYTAKQYDFVLISLTSVFDVYNLLKVIAGLSYWQKGKRPFKTIIGGFGCQNVTPLREYIDFVFFGRVEQVFAQDIQELLQHGDLDRPYVMRLHEKIHPVTVHQSTECYPHELQVRPNTYHEMEIGCPRKCLFCHYSFARKHLKIHDKTFTGSGMKYDGGSELIFGSILKDISEPSPLVKMPKGRIRTAIDGFSERLRFAFNKRYSNQMIVDTFNELSKVWQGKLIYMYVYMIGSYPTETQEERQEFIDTMGQVKISSKEIVILLHVTPFHPSPLTPSAYLPVNVLLDWGKIIEDWRQLGVVYEERCVYKRDGVKIAWDIFHESPYSLLQGVLIERATEETDRILNTILFSPKFQGLKVHQKFNSLERLFDLTPYLREYHTSEQLPTWYLESYIPNVQLKKMGRKLKARLGMPEKGDSKCSS